MINQHTERAETMLILFPTSSKRKLDEVFFAQHSTQDRQSFATRKRDIYIPRARARTARSIAIQTKIWLQLNEDKT